MLISEIRLPVVHWPTERFLPELLNLLRRNQLLSVATARVSPVLQAECLSTLRPGVAGLGLGSSPRRSPTSSGVWGVELAPPGLC